MRTRRSVKHEQRGSRARRDLRALDRTSPTPDRPLPPTMSSLRCLAASSRAVILRPSAPTSARLLSSTRVARDTVVPAGANLGTIPPPKKPVGGFRGGCVSTTCYTMDITLTTDVSNYPRIVGFFFGFSLAASFAAYNLLDEYKQASAALQASVEELHASTEKVRTALFSVHSLTFDAPP